MPEARPLSAPPRRSPAGAGESVSPGAVRVVGPGAKRLHPQCSLPGSPFLEAAPSSCAPSSRIGPGSHEWCKRRNCGAGSGLSCPGSLSPPRRTSESSSDKWGFVAAGVRSWAILAFSARTDAQDRLCKPNKSTLGWSWLFHPLSGPLGRAQTQPFSHSPLPRKPTILLNPAAGGPSPTLLPWASGAT